MGAIPIDLILFGMIAAFLVLRLKGILGRRAGFERPAAQAVPPREAQAAPMQPAGRDAAIATRTIPEPASATGQTLMRMKALDSAFEPGSFLDGAEKAFQMIVRAFAAGERAALRPLLSDDTYHAFEAAIATREKAGHAQITDIRAIHAMTIERADIRGTTGAITVRFVSDQVNLTQDQAGHPVTGTDAVTEINDLWTFERDLNLTDPAWHLVAARSA